MTYITKAVVIKYQKYKDYDRIYTVYSEKFGKISVLARGSNKIKSKLAGHLEPCVLSNLMVADGRIMPILAQANTIKPFIDIREDYNKFKAASVILESVDKMIYSYSNDKFIFDLIVNSLSKIENFLETEDIIDFIYHYFLHFLIFLGYAHDIKHKSALKPLLIADILSNGIIVDENARSIIDGYLKKALDEKRLNSLDFLLNEKSF